LAKKINYVPLDDFKQFHRSPKIKRMIIAGYGGGKTYSLCNDLLMTCNENKYLPAGLLCPTIKMFKRDVWPTLEEIADQNKIRIKYSRQDAEIKIPDTGTTCYVFHGEDHGDSIRGPNLASMHINEATLLSLKTYHAAIARVRIKSAKRLTIAMSGTFEGNTELYEHLVDDKGCDMFYTSSRKNPYLPESYIQMLEESYDEEMRKQYIDGLPVRSMGQAAAKNFRRDLHVSEKAAWDSNGELLISIDFNVDPMAAAFWCHIPSMKPRLQCFKEVCMNAADTYMLADLLTKQLYEMGMPLSQVKLFPDPAGNARSTKGILKTDIQILRDAGFSQIYFKRRIVSVKDCMNAVTAQLEKNEILIHPECKNVIADFEQVKYKESSFEFDKSNLKRTHWLDGTKNMIDYLYPVVRPATPKPSYSMF
jgi:phage terminase large subunit